MIYAHYVSWNIHLFIGFAWLRMKWMLQYLPVTWNLTGVGSETRVALPIDLFTTSLLLRATVRKYLKFSSALGTQPRAQWKVWLAPLSIKCDLYIIHAMFSLLIGYNKYIELTFCIIIAAVFTCHMGILKNVHSQLKCSTARASLTVIL